MEVLAPPVQKLFPELPSFLDYSIAWHAGEISLAELLTIPRSPLVIGTLGDVAAFAEEAIIEECVRDEYGDMDLGPNKIRRMVGDQSGMAIDTIDAFASNHGIPSDYTAIFAERTTTRIDFAHVDGVVPSDLLLQAIVVDKDPTIFYAMQIDELSGSICSDKIRSRVERIAKHEPEKIVAVGSANAGDIVAFDGTVPHKGPSTNDTRTMLRKDFLVY